MLIPNKVPFSEESLADLSRSVKLIGLSEAAGNGLRNTVERLQCLLSGIIETADLPDVSIHHRVVACNAACAFADHCMESLDPGLNELIAGNTTWKRYLDLYLDRHAQSKTKSMRQLLITITKLILNEDSYTADATSSALQVASKQLCDVLFTSYDNPRAKAAIHALTYFIKKNLVTADDLIKLAINWKVYELPVQHNLPPVTVLLVAVLEYAAQSDLAGAAGQLFEVLTTSLKRTSTETQPELLWFSAVQISIAKYPDCIQSFKSYVFPALFKSNFAEYVMFLRFLGLDSFISGVSQSSSSLRLSGHDSALFAALQAGNDVGLIRVIDGEAPKLKVVEVRNGNICLADRSLIEGHLLCHSSEYARLTGLVLLINCSNTTRPLTKGSFHALKSALPAAFVETDANVRSEVISLVQSLIDRMRSVTAALHREDQLSSKTKANDKLNQDLGYTSPAEAMTKHRDFLAWFYAFICAELRLTASYQRHITALKSLESLARSGLDRNISDIELSKSAKGQTEWPFKLRLTGSLMLRKLTDLVLDPFDDVRSTATTILKMFYSSVQEPLLLHQAVQFEATFNRAEEIMLKTGRVDHADGVARLFDMQATMSLRHVSEYDSSYSGTHPLSVTDILNKLVESIEQAVLVAQSNLGTAVADRPVHGLFTAARYLLENKAVLQHILNCDNFRMRKLMNRLNVSIQGIWNVVREQLCHDAPEGHLPENMEELVDVTTKDVLSYAWRALKEASLLMRTMVTIGPSYFYPGGTSESTSLKYFGDACFEQLAGLRHRGAFSTVSQTFAAICRQCHMAGQPEQLILENWYHDTLQLIRSSGTVTTRRSAGIPSLLAGILAADPTEHSLKKPIDDLQRIVQMNTNKEADDDDLPQVHALNCLKVIFSTTKLATSSERHVSEALETATSCLGSNTWAIRNCGLMLFRSLMDRLLGTSGQVSDQMNKSNSSSSKLSYERYPELIKFVLRILRSEVKSQRGESSSNTADDKESLDPSLALEVVFPVLDLLTKGPVPVHDRQEVLDLVLELTGSDQWQIRDIAARAYASLTNHQEHSTLIKVLLVPGFTDNATHGLLLCIKHKLNHWKNGSNLSCNVPYRVFDGLWKSDASAIVKAGYLDIINDVGFLMVTQLQYTGSKGMEWTDSDLPAHRIPPRNIAHVLEEYYLLSWRIVASLPDFRQTNSTPLDAAAAQNLLLRVLTLSHEWPLPDTRSEHNAVRDWLLGELNYIRTVTTPEAICQAISDLNKKFQFINTKLMKQKRIHLQTYFAFMCCLMQSLDWPTEVAVAARAALAENLPQLYEGNKPSEWCLIRMHFCVSATSNHASHRSVLERLFEDYNASDRSFNLIQCLRIWGYVIDSRICGSRYYHEQIPSLETEKDILQDDFDMWIKFVQDSLSENKDVSMRCAAAQSLEGLRYAKDRGGLHVELSFLLAVYDCLVDDEESVRIIGAKIVTGYFASVTVDSRPLSPPWAVDCLLRHLRERFSDDQLLHWHSASRLTEWDIRSGMSRPSFHQRLLEARQQKTTLFSVERQNLYVDDVQEAERWAGVLKATEHVKEIQTLLIARFCAWVLEGLNELVSISQLEKDGPMGWTAAQECFTYGMRVLYGADVLLAWAGFRTDVEEVKILKSLQELLDLGQEQSLHQSWLSRGEQIVERSVLRKLKGRHKVVAEMEDLLPL